MEIKSFPIFYLHFRSAVWERTRTMVLWRLIQFLLNQIQWFNSLTSLLDSCVNMTRPAQKRHRHLQDTAVAARAVPLSLHCCSQSNRHCLSAAWSTRTNRTLSPNIRARTSSGSLLSALPGVQPAHLRAPATSGEQPSQSHLHRAMHRSREVQLKLTITGHPTPLWGTASWSEYSLCWSDEAEAKETKIAGCTERSCACGLNHGRLPGCAEMLQHFLEGRIQKRRCLFAPLIAAKLFTGKSRVNKSKPNQRTQGQERGVAGLFIHNCFHPIPEQALAHQLLESNSDAWGALFWYLELQL